MLLAVLAGEFAELGGNARILGENDIGLELEHARGRVTQCFLVKRNVPDTGGAVLRVTGARGVNKALLAGRVRTDQCGQTMRLDCLGTEELDQGVSIGEDVWKEAIGARDIAIPPANKRPDTGPAREYELENRVWHEKIRWLSSQPE